MILLERQIDLAECIVCKRPCTTGISVLGWRVCTQCEEALVKSKAHNPGYDMYVASLRAIWRGISLNEDLGNGGGEPTEVSHSWEASVCTNPHTN